MKRDYLVTFSKLSLVFLLLLLQLLVTSFSIIIIIIAIIINVPIGIYLNSYLGSLLYGILLFMILSLFIYLFFFSFIHFSFLINFCSIFLHLCHLLNFFFSLTFWFQLVQLHFTILNLIPTSLQNLREEDLNNLKYWENSSRFSLCCCVNYSSMDLVETVAGFGCRLNY